MRYVGGKTRIAKWVASHIQAQKGVKKKYLEPFVGSGANFAEHAPLFEQATAGDASRDLVLMWQAIAGGWEPPLNVSRDEYAALRHAPSSALRGFAGYGLSFGGKWFGGYATYKTRDFIGEARRGVLAHAEVFARAEIVHKDYRQHEVDADTLVYCDPPYAGTLEYGCVGWFNSAEFWKVAHGWAKRGATVIVSEERAPVGWRVIAEKERKAALKIVRAEEHAMRVERLYVRHAPNIIRIPRRPVVSIDAVDCIV
jgi:DNA adenine methylase